jgi:hypothetical protein
LTAHGANPAENLATSDAFADTGTFRYALGENLMTLDSLTLTVTQAGTISNGIEIYSLASYGIAPAGACGFTLEIFGKGFQSNSVVTWNGSSRATTYISYPLIVWLGGYATSPKYFSIVSGTPTIAAARLSGGAVIVEGANFVPGYGSAPGIVSAGTTVLWNGQPLTTSWISYTRLQAQPPPKIGAIGNVTISVADTGCFAN